MEKLDKVIAGLRNCSYPSENCYYSDCPYCGERNGDKVCMDFLMEDALEVIEDLKIAVTAVGVLERYRPAFEALAKGVEE